MRPFFISLEQAERRCAIADLNVAISVVGQDAASGPLSKISTTLNQVAASANEGQSAVASFGSALDSVGRIAAGVTVGEAVFQGIRDVISAAEDAIVGFNAHLQQSQVAWTTFLGSAPAANEMLSNLQQFAATTPFRFQDLEQGARLLSAMGVPAEQVMGDLKDIATAAAASGRGAEGLQQLSYSLSELQATGTVNARIMRQLAMDGIPAWEMLAESMGKSVSQVQELSKAGQITADQFMAAFHEYATSHWGDMLAEQSHTFLGALSTLQDNLQMGTAAVFKPFFDLMAEGMANLGAASQSQDFQEFVIRAQGSVQDLVNVLGQLNPQIIAIPLTFAAAATAVNVLGDAAVATVPKLLALRDAAIFSNITAGLGIMGSEMGALEGVSVGLGGALELVGVELMAMLGPIGLVGIAVGAFAVAYETNFLHVRDVTDEVVARAVDDAGIWVTAMNQMADAASKVHAPDIGISLPNVQLPDWLKEAAGKAGMLGLAGTFGPLGLELTAVDQATQLLGQSQAATAQNTDYFKDSLENTSTAADKHANALARVQAGMLAVGDAAQLATADAKALESALGGQSSVLNLAVASDPALQAMNDQLSAMQANLAGLRDAQTQASATSRQFKANIEESIPGLQAFDNATFGIQQHLSAVQLAIEEKKLGRMEGRPSTGRPQQEEALLQEELKVRGLQRDVTFGGAIRQDQLAQQSTTAVRSTETVAIREQQDAITATQLAIKNYTDLLKEQDKVLGAINPAITQFLPYLQGTANLFAVSADQMGKWIQAFGPAEAAKQADLRNQAFQIGVALPAEIAAVAAQGGDINQIPGIQNLQENQQAKRRGGVQGFASGGSFFVGGSGGTDSQLVQFYATPGEPVSVGGNQQGGIQLTLNGPLVHIAGGSASDPQAIGRAVEDGLQRFIGNLTSRTGQPYAGRNANLVGAW